jgi:hypothetical protein
MAKPEGRTDQDHANNVKSERKRPVGLLHACLIHRLGFGSGQRLFGGGGSIDRGKLPSP